MEHILEKLLNGEHSYSALIAGLLITLALHLILKIFYFLLDLGKSLRKSDNEKMDKLAEAMGENTKAIYALTGDLKHFKNKIGETDTFIEKQKSDHRRLFATVKELAGDKWREIQKKVMEDEILERGKP